MSDRLSAALDRSGRWTRELARAARFAYPTAPVDTPRELARFVCLSAPLHQVLAAEYAAGRPPPRITVRHPRPVRMGQRRWPVPVLHGIADLPAWLGLSASDLCWFADTQGRTGRSTHPAWRHYAAHWQATAAGGARLIEAPKRRLRAIQRQILHDILDLIPNGEPAHGFRVGRSALSFAGPHAGRPVVLRFDLESYFSSIGRGRVYGVFRLAGYAEPVAHTLAGLTTTATTLAVRREARSGRLRQLLAAPHLPQGAPTSPALANAVTFGLDRRLAGLAASVGAAYTRYADDLAFSLAEDDRVSVATLLQAVPRIAADEGFAHRAAKTAVRRANGRQQLAGIVLDAHPNVARSEVDRLRAILHNCATNGSAGQNMLAHRDFQAYLAGRVGWVAAVNPARGRRLRATFDEITWPESG